MTQTDILPEIFPMVQLNVIDYIKEIFYSVITYGDRL